LLLSLCLLQLSL